MLLRLIEFPATDQGMCSDPVQNVIVTNVLQFIGTEVKSSSYSCNAWLMTAVPSRGLHKAHYIIAQDSQGCPRCSGEGTPAHSITDMISYYSWFCSPELWEPRAICQPAGDWYLPTIHLCFSLLAWFCNKPTNPKGSVRGQLQMGFWIGVEMSAESQHPTTRRTWRTLRGRLPPSLGQADLCSLTSALLQTGVALWTRCSFPQCNTPIVGTYTMDLQQLLDKGGGKRETIILNVCIDSFIISNIEL